MQPEDKGREGEEPYFLALWLRNDMHYFCSPSVVESCVKTGDTGRHCSWLGSQFSVTTL